MTVLEDLPGGQLVGVAARVSGDGLRIVGEGFSSTYPEAVLWTPDGTQSLPPLFVERPEGLAHGISPDGTTVVGSFGRPPVTSEAFRWTESEGTIGLGDLPGGDFESVAFGVSDDGAVIVGISRTDLGQEAFRWTASSGMVGLGELAGGGYLSEARDVSSDGSIVVGYSAVIPSGTATLNEAFRWTADSGMVGLGHMPGGIESLAFAVSGDGRIVVGSDRLPFTGIDDAIIWDATHGMRNLQDVLESELGLDVPLNGWRLSRADAISTDGEYIAGTGINPAGNIEAWIVHVPEPSSLALAAVTMGVAIITLSFRRRAVCAETPASPVSFRAAPSCVCRSAQQAE